MVKLSVPAMLPYRGVVLGAVASMCRLVRSGVPQEQEASQPKLDENFDDKIVSAVGEAFNNIVLHGYSGSHRGKVDIELELGADVMTIRLFDTGKAFDPLSEREPDLDSLPEAQLGLYIIKKFTDAVTYRQGVPPLPNVLTLTKRLFRGGDEMDSRESSE
jgi:anti-sigma regulatory factor (Ser/Thr protein kinase)